MSSSSPVRVVSGWKLSNAFRTASARSDTPSFGRAVQIARKICHLWTTLSGGRLEAAICVATWASVSVRRPKGVVGVTRLHVFALASGQRKSARRNGARLSRDS